MTDPTQAPRTLNLDALISRVTEGHKTIFDLSRGNADGDSIIELSLQKLLPPNPEPPPRAETPARQHAFYEAASFAAYLARYGKNGDTVVYADPSTETTWAVLEEKAEEIGRDLDEARISA